MSKTGETIVKEYLVNRGLVVRKIPEGDTKTADFAVYTNDELAFYLEEKTLELTPVRWRNIDPVYSAIAKHVREALKQFNCLNPDKRFPNVLAITSMDPGKNVNHLFLF